MPRILEKLRRLLGTKKLREGDLHEVDEAFLRDPSLSPMDKLSVAFMQFHRTFMLDRYEERLWRKRRNVALIVFAIAGTVTSIIYNADKIAKTIPSRDYAAIVNIAGGIGEASTASHGPINAALKAAFEDPRAKRIILRIESPGGRPNESEAIINEMARLKALHKKPVEAVVENIGASAAYMIAVHADTLYVGRYSLVGSVGAMIDTWNVHKVIDRLNAEKMTFVSGRYKDLLNPFREMRSDERAKVQSMVDKLAGVFADEVIQRRKGKLTLSRDDLTTGEVWIGGEAVRLGLADKIGTVTDVAAAYNLEPRDMGPHEDKGFYIPRMSTFFESIGASIRDGLVNGGGREGVVVN